MKSINISEETYEKIKDQLTEDETKPIKELEDLVGQIYTFWCARYIYHGEVEAVSSTFITLKNASVVYDTGELDSKSALDKQSLPKGCNILWSAVENFNKMRW